MSNSNNSIFETWSLSRFREVTGESEGRIPKLADDGMMVRANLPGEPMVNIVGWNVPEGWVKVELRYWSAEEMPVTALAREVDRDKRYFFLTNPAEAGGSTVPVQMDKNGVPLEPSGSAVRLQRNPDGSIPDQAPVMPDIEPVLQKTAAGEFWADLTSKNHERFSAQPSDLEAIVRAAANQQQEEAKRKTAEEHPFLKASRERLEPESWSNQEQRRMGALQALVMLMEHDMVGVTKDLAVTLRQAGQMYEWLRSGTLPGQEVPNAFKDWGA